MTNPYHKPKGPGGGEFTFGPGGPVIKTDQNRKMPKKFVHVTNKDQPEISTGPERIIPNSLSASDRALFEYGKNAFVVSPNKNAKILQLDVEGKTKDYYNFGDYSKETPKQIGKRVYDYAKSKGYDGVYLTNVPVVGKELDVINPQAFKVTTPPKVKNVYEKNPSGIGYTGAFKQVTIPGKEVVILDPRKFSKG